MLEGINYLHAKFQINIIKKKVIKLLELEHFGKEKKEIEIANTKELLSQL